MATSDYLESLHKNLSLFVEEQLPDHIQQELSKLGPDGKSRFLVFMEAYFEWLESDNNPYRHIAELRNYRDVDFTLESFLSHFIYELLPGVPIAALDDRNVNKSLLLKNIREFYLAKGSEKSFKFLFYLMYGLEANIHYDRFIRLSESDFVQEKSLRVLPEYPSSDSDMMTLVGNEIIGQTSGAEAVISKAIQWKSGNRLVTEYTLEPSSIVGVFLPNEIVQAVDRDSQKLVIAYPEDTISVGQSVIGETNNAYATITSIELDDDPVANTSVQVRLSNSNVFKRRETFRWADGPFVPSGSPEATIVRVEDAYMTRLVNNEHIIMANLQGVVSSVDVEPDPVSTFTDIDIADIEDLELNEYTKYPGVDYRVGDYVTFTRDDAGQTGYDAWGRVAALSHGPIDKIHVVGYDASGDGYVAFPTEALVLDFDGNTVSGTFEVGEDITQSESNFAAVVHSVAGNTVVVVDFTDAMPSLSNNIDGETSTAYGYLLHSPTRQIIGDTVRFVNDYLRVEQYNAAFEVNETITGQLSGATAIVRKWDADKKWLWVDNIRGTFKSKQVGEWKFDWEDIQGSESNTVAKILSHESSGGSGASARIQAVDDNGAVESIYLVSGGQGYHFLPFVYIDSENGANANIMAFSSTVGAIERIDFGNSKVGTSKGHGWGYDIDPIPHFDSKDFIYDKQIRFFNTDRIADLFNDSFGCGMEHVILDSDNVEIGYDTSNLDAIAFSNCMIKAVFTSNHTAIGDSTLAAVAEHKGVFTDDTGLLSYGSHRIFDGFRVQQFAYRIEVEKELRHWAKIVRELVHPAGMKMFAEYPLLIEISADSNIANVTANVASV